VTFGHRRGRIGSPRRATILGRPEPGALDARLEAQGIGTRAPPCTAGGRSDHGAYGGAYGGARGGAHAGAHRGARERRGDGPAHGAGRPDQDEAAHARAEAGSGSVIPLALAASRTAFSVAGSTGTSGRRSSFSIRPMAESRNLAGAGFDSMNSALKSGSSV